MGFLLQLQTTTEVTDDETGCGGQDTRVTESIARILRRAQVGVNQSTEPVGLVTDCHAPIAALQICANLPINTPRAWTEYRFGYQYDIIVKNRGYDGFIMEAKYTDVRAQLATPLQVEFTRQRAPIPALGGIGRVYVVPNISVTGELTYFTIPDSVGGRYRAHYTDLDVYGTVNFTNNIGVKGGYRSMDLGYNIKDDTGTFTLKGIYFGAVLRY